MNIQQNHIQYLIKIISRLIALPQTNQDVDNHLNNAVAHLQKALAVDSLGNQDVEGYYAEPQRVNSTPQQSFNNSLNSAFSEANQAFNKKRAFDQMIRNNQLAQQGAVGQPTTQEGQI